MERFRRGDEVWGRREDGTWVRWERRTLTWLEQPEAPPAHELEPMQLPQIYLPKPRQTPSRDPTRARSIGLYITVGLIIATFVLGGVVAILRATSAGG